MNTLQVANLFLEGYCLIICLILHFYLIYTKNGREDKARKFYEYLLVLNIFLIIADSLEWLYSGASGDTAYRALWIGITAYYYISGAITLFMINYIMAVAEKNVTIPNFFRWIGRILFGLQLILTTVNIFSQSMVYVNNRHHYVYGNILLTTGLSAIGYVVCFLMVLIYGSKLPKRTFVNLGILVAVPALGSLFQLIYDNIAFVTPCYTFGFLAAFLFIQAENKLESEMVARESADTLNHSLERYKDEQDLLITQIITALAYSVEAKDRYTNGHSVRVATYVREMVHRMGYDEVDQMKAYYMGLLHDIGKIRIPDEIINKKSRLTDEEYEVIKLHTVSGYHILKAITILPELSVGARWHHERYDGKGYPNGLIGDNIPLMARIIAVADAYDAMTSNRSYRNIMPQSKVRAEIEKGMGTQFDPEVAKVMLTMIDEDYDYDMKQEKSLRKERILVIDDDTFVHKFITLALADEPYLVTCVSDPDEAKELVLNENFDLCLLDVQMPEIDGFEMCEWIRSHKHRMKIVFLSGDKEFTKIQRAQDLGVADYITKPVLVPVLKETIMNVLIHS